MEGLAVHFGVTTQTVRRDLTDLAEIGKLERVHGGAILPSGAHNIDYADRQTINHSGKSAIARSCAESVPDNSSVFLNIGTSTEAVARALVDHKNMLFVTNNLNVAQILSAAQTSEVIVTGGRLRGTDMGLIGAPAVETIQKFKFDYAIIGCSALDQDGDLLDYDLQEISVSKSILGAAKTIFVVADQSKFTRSAPVKIASLANVDRLFTDAPVTSQLSKSCQEWGTEITLCPTEDTAQKPR